MVVLDALDDANQALAGAAACTAVSACGRFRVAGAHGQVWLLERLLNSTSGATLRRRLLGDFDLVSTNPMSVRLCETGDGRIFLFAGVMRRTNHSLKMWYLSENCNDQEDKGFVGGCAPMQIDISNDTKLRGFGDVAFLGKCTESTYDFRIACGLGLGKLHVWKLRVNPDNGHCDQTHEGSLSMRASLSCTGCIFQKSGQCLLTAISIDDLVQRWDLAQCAAETMKGNVYAATPRMGLRINCKGMLYEQGFSKEQHEQICHLHAGFHVLQSRALRRLVLKHPSSWSLVFHLKEKNCIQSAVSKEEPPFPETLVQSPMGSSLSSNKADSNEEIELEECFYQGDLDKSGLAHGFGTQSGPSKEMSGDSGRRRSSSSSSSKDREMSCDTACEDELYFEYRGLWMHGTKHGKGILWDHDSGQIVYDGEWQSGFYHGQGMLLVPGLERYSGSFWQGRRHGFGVLDILSNKSLSIKLGSGGKKRIRYHQRYAGERLQGFWEKGLIHGLGRWSFPAGCEALNQTRPDDLMHLGRIVCISAHKQGVLLRELLFARDEAPYAIPAEEWALFQCKPCEAKHSLRSAGFKLANAFAAAAADVKGPGWWPGSGVCWRCLGDGPEIACSECSLTLHRRCCSSRGTLACPMPRCAGRAVKMSPLPLQGFQVSRNSSFASLVTSTLDKLLSKRREKENLPSGESDRGASGDKYEASKRPGTASSSSAEAQQVAQACALAKKLVSQKRSSLRANLQKRANERLQVHRSQEIKHRKLWRRAEEDLGEQNGQLAKDLTEKQQHQSAVTLRLKQLQGLDLNSLRVSQLSELQATVEKLIGAGLQALEQQQAPSPEKN